MHNSFHIASDRDGTRLDIFLSEKLFITRTKVKEMIDEGHVRVGGRIPKPSLKIKEFMEIEGEIPEEEPLSLTPEDIPLNILYEDEYFLAINKPADMVVHPSFGHSSGTLVNAVFSYLSQKSQISNLKFQIESGVRPGIVHRLDKGTTGVILVAKDSRTQELLSDLFKERGVRKTYRAIVEGDIKNEEWIARVNIGRHPVERKKMAVLKAGGRDAETSFKVLKKLGGFTYLEAYPKTGRTHQIRVHLAHAGHPVVGDETYGRKTKTFASRPLLHAYRIEFAHPVNNVFIKIEAPVPIDMQEFIERRCGI